MKRLIAFIGPLFLLAASSIPSAASDKSDIAAVVKKWIGDFNKGDMKAFTAACAPNTAIVDAFPPYAWTSCASWMSDYDTNNKAIEGTDGKLWIGKPVYFEETGAHAYTNYPVKFSDRQKGKPVVYKGDWAITLQKISGAWLVTGSGSAWRND